MLIEVSNCDEVQPSCSPCWIRIVIFVLSVNRDLVGGVIHYRILVRDTPLAKLCALVRCCPSEPVPLHQLMIWTTTRSSSEHPLKAQPVADLHSAQRGIRRQLEKPRYYSFCFFFSTLPLLWPGTSIVIILRTSRRWSSIRGLGFGPQFLPVNKNKWHYY